MGVRDRGLAAQHAPYVPARYRWRLTTLSEPEAGLGCRHAALCQTLIEQSPDDGVAGSTLVRFAVPRLPACICGGSVGCVARRKLRANHVLSGCSRPRAHAGESRVRAELHLHFSFLSISNLHENVVRHRTLSGKVVLTTSNSSDITCICGAIICIYILAVS